MEGSCGPEDHRERWSRKLPPIASLCRGDRKTREFSRETPGRRDAPPYLALLASLTGTSPLRVPCGLYDDRWTVRQKRQVRCARTSPTNGRMAFETKKPRTSTKFPCCRSAPKAS